MTKIQKTGSVAFSVSEASLQHPCRKHWIFNAGKPFAFKPNSPYNSAALLHKVVQWDNYIKASTLFWHFFFIGKWYKYIRRKQIVKKSARSINQLQHLHNFTLITWHFLTEYISVLIQCSGQSLLSHVSKINAVNEVKQCQIVKYLFRLHKLHLPPCCSSREDCTFWKGCMWWYFARMEHIHASCFTPQQLD